MTTYMYITLQGDDQILRFVMDPDTGSFDLQETIAISGAPAPLAISPDRTFLYVGRRSDFEISSYRINQQTGGLSPIGTVSLEGEPCHMATDRSGKFLLSAYYQAGHAAVHPIGADGAANGPPVEWLATATGAHCFQTDPSNQFAFLPHIAGKGPNAIYQYRFDAQTGHVTPNIPPTVNPEREDGPRHYCFHPNQNILYFSNEQGCGVTAYHFDVSTGTLSPFQTVSTLPDDFDGRNSCAQIQITPSGQFLYAPNRGHNSIAGFAVEAATGQLTPIGHFPTEPVPRAFSIDPTGNFLYAAGLESGRLAAYRIDQTTGTLSHLETYAVGERPMWVLITNLGG
ncbi:MAG: lactonase family protein [Candidatus Tectomicrobia bacterium]